MESNNDLSDNDGDTPILSNLDVNDEENYKPIWLLNVENNLKKFSIQQDSFNIAKNNLENGNSFKFNSKISFF